MPTASARGVGIAREKRRRTGHTESAAARLFSAVTSLAPLASPSRSLLSSPSPSPPPHRPGGCFSSVPTRTHARAREPPEEGDRAPPMHPKLSRAARRLLCCAGAASREDLSDEGSGSLRWVFSLRELRSATNSFNYDNKIGEGSLGSVYWGQVWDGSQIAVKRLKNAKNGTEVEFASEVEILGRIRHKNLLSFRGYCADGPERILVYDYMANSSLYAHLHGPLSAECLLDWRRRASIAIGAARALLYLHHHATPQIIHGSIKATNVLLDSDFQAHVGDFGLIRLIPDGMDHEKITSENQRGYLAPEYIMFGKPTEGCDVYSFGIILLELASGKKPIEKSGSVRTYGIRNWVLLLAKEGRYDEIADSKLSDKFSESELKRMVLVGLACTHSEPEKRPTMLEVVPLLKGESKETLLKLERDELFRPDLAVSSQGTSTPEGSTDSVPIRKDQELVGP